MEEKGSYLKIPLGIYYLIIFGFFLIMTYFGYCYFLNEKPNSWDMFFVLLIILITGALFIIMSPRGNKKKP